MLNPGFIVFNNNIGCEGRLPATAGQHGRRRPVTAGHGQTCACVACCVCVVCSCCLCAGRVCPGAGVGSVLPLRWSSSGPVCLVFMASGASSVGFIARHMGGVQGTDLPWTSEGGISLGQGWRVWIDSSYWIMPPMALWVEKAFTLDLLLQLRRCAVRRW